HGSTAVRLRSIHRFHVRTSFFPTFSHSAIWSGAARRRFERAMWRAPKAASERPDSKRKLMAHVTDREPDVFSVAIVFPRSVANDLGISCRLGARVGAPWFPSNTLNLWGSRCRTTSS